MCYLAMEARCFAKMVLAQGRKDKDATSRKMYQKGYDDGELVGVQNERKRRAASPYARDWPHAGALEVVTVPCETVTLRADYIASADQLYHDPVLKDQVLAEMSKVLYAQAMDFIDARIEDDPLLCGVRFAGRLIVAKRKE